MAPLIGFVRAACASALLAVAGCGVTSAGRNQQTRADAPAAPASVDAGEYRFDAIERQPLPPGACGMFLWARSTQQPVLIFAAFANPAEARVRLRGRDLTLARTSAEGVAEYGHYETQVFANDRLTLTVDVTFDAQRQLSDGAAIERGVIRVRDREGWETVLPVGGLVGCGV